MAKRSVKFGTYDTAATGGWTLNDWTLSAAEYQEDRVVIPGRSGSLDLTAALTNGEPRYNDRTLSVRLESSEGTRLDREAKINTMINRLDGWKMDIVLPDDSAHYLVGRIHVSKEYNDPARAAVRVTAVCEPWRYNNDETTVSLTASSSEQTAELTNQGRRTVVPVLVIAGGSVNLVYGSASWSLTDGTYQLPDLTLPQGGGTLKYSGSGTITITYREAVL